MKRKTKNILMTLVLIIMFGALVLTGIYTSKNSNQKSMNDNFMNNMVSPNKQNSGQNMGEPPEKPNGEQNSNLTQPPEMSGNEQNNGMMQQPEYMNNQKVQISIIYYILMIGESLIIALIITYLLMSNFNKKTFKETFINSDKITIYVLLNIIFTTAITMSSNYFIKSYSNQLMENVNTESSEKDIIDLDKSNIVSESSINLSEYDKDITISKSGTYVLTGNSEHSIIVEASDNDEVELVLNNVEINNAITATIIALSGKSLTIKTSEKSINNLTDGGNSEYDGCIYSDIPLIIDGTGVLNVVGNQNEGEGIATNEQNITINGSTISIVSNDDGLNAGGDNGGTITINGGTLYIDAGGDGIDSNNNLIINGGTLFVMGSDIGGDAGLDTDNGYEINGGLVVAVGSDMIETPEKTSKQNTLAFQFNEAIAANTIISLLDEEDNEVVSFKSTKSFKTIIISSSELELNKVYKLYSNGSHTGTIKYGIYSNGNYIKGNKLELNNSNEFSLSSNITLFR